MESEESKAETHKQSEAEYKRKHPSTQWKKVFNGAWQDFSPKHLSNLIFVVVGLLLSPIVGYIMNKPKIMIGGSALAVTILVWVFAYQMMKQVDQPKERGVASKAAPNSEVPPKPGSTANEERVLLDVKLEYLLGFFTKYNEAQAQKLIETYLGKWVQISGEVFDVSRYSDESIVTISPPTPTIFGVLAQFEEQRWVDRVQVLNRGEPITVFGQLTKMKSISPKYVTIWLDKCEVVE